MASAFCPVCTRTARTKAMPPEVDLRCPRRKRQPDRELWVEFPPLRPPHHHRMCDESAASTTCLTSCTPSRSADGGCCVSDILCYPPDGVLFTYDDAIMHSDCLLCGVTVYGCTHDVYAVVMQPRARPRMLVIKMLMRIKRMLALAPHRILACRSPTPPHGPRSSSTSNRKCEHLRCTLYVCVCVCVCVCVL